MKRVLVVLLVVAALGCATLSVKQQASNVRQSFHQGLVTLHEVEKALCAPPPAALNTCAANPRVLTDAQHQAFSRAMVTALDADIKAGNAIIAWTPGLPIPPEVTALKFHTDTLFKIADALAPTGKAAEFIAKAKAVVDLVNELIEAFTSGDAVEVDRLTFELWGARLAFLQEAR